MAKKITYKNPNIEKSYIKIQILWLWKPYCAPENPDFIGGPYGEARTGKKYPFFFITFTYFYLPYIYAEFQAHP